MSFAKFISLIQTESLHCARLGTMEDRCEGSLPLDTGRILDYISPDIPAAAWIEKVRGMLFVSCWCEREDESDLLWKQYAGAEGVAVRTTIGKLKRALDRDDCIGRVRYLSDGEAGVNPGLLQNFAMWKRPAFDSEREVRIVRMRTQSAGQPGVLLPIPLPDTLERVMVSPRASEWFVEVVRGAVERFRGSVPVEHSRL